jgi:Uma2 family endonuclease
MESSMAALPNPPLTEEEYLAIERKAEFKSEFWNGRMVAMSGAREEHNTVTLNAGSLLRQQLLERQCWTYVLDMKVRTSERLYTYPDVVVVCGKRQFFDATKDAVLNPVAIIEVLSPSTESYDRGKKFEIYRDIPSMREYLLLSADRVHAELYARTPDDKWLLTVTRSLDETVELNSCGCRLKLSDVYSKVEFPESA